MKMQRVLFLTFLTLIMLLGSTIPVLAQEDDEEDLNPEVFNPVYMESGQIIIDSFGSGIYARLYAFNGTEGDLVSIRMDPGPDSTVDPYLVLFGSEGQVYITDDDGGTLSSALIDSFELPETGTYLILATDFWRRRNQPSADEEARAGAQSYQVQLSGNQPQDDPADDSDDLLLEVSFVEAEFNDELSLEITPQIPVIFVTFIAEAGDLVTVEAISEDASVDTLLYLFDFRGQRLIVDDDSGLELDALIENYEIPLDGLYLAFVTAFDFDRAYEDGWNSSGEIILLLERR